MKRKLPKNLMRWIILCLIVFVVGLFVAKMLTPSQAEDGKGKSSGGGGLKPKMEKKPVNVTAILVILGILAVALGYGYYREKKRRTLRERWGK